MPRKNTNKVVRKQGESGTVSKITTPKSGTRTVYSTPSTTTVSKTNRRRTTMLVTDKKTGKTYELTSVDFARGKPSVQTKSPKLVSPGRGGAQIKSPKSEKK